MLRQSFVFPKKCPFVFYICIHIFISQSASQNTEDSVNICQARCISHHAQLGNVSMASVNVQDARPVHCNSISCKSCMIGCASAPSCMFCAATLHQTACFQACAHRNTLSNKPSTITLVGGRFECLCRDWSKLASSQSVRCALINTPANQHQSKHLVLLVQYRLVDSSTTNEHWQSSFYMLSGPTSVKQPIHVTLRNLSSLNEYLLRARFVLGDSLSSWLDTELPVQESAEGVLDARSVSLSFAHYSYAVLVTNQSILQPVLSASIDIHTPNRTQLFPSCSYQLQLNKSHSSQLLLNWPGRVVVRHLQFDSVTTLRVQSQPVSLHTPTCLQATAHNFTLCGPGPVRLLEYSILGAVLFADWLQPEFTSPHNDVLNYVLVIASDNCDQPHQQIETNNTSVELELSAVPSACSYSLSVSAVAMNGRFGIPYTISIPTQHNPSRNHFTPVIVLVLAGACLMVCALLYVVCPAAVLDTFCKTLKQCLLRVMSNQPISTGHYPMSMQRRVQSEPNVMIGRYTPRLRRTLSTYTTPALEPLYTGALHRMCKSVRPLKPTVTRQLQAEDGDWLEPTVSRVCPKVGVDWVHVLGQDSTITYVSSKGLIVFPAQLLDKTPVFVKTLNKGAEVSISGVASLEHEWQCLQAIPVHPNIVSLLYASALPQITICLQYCPNGTLASLLKSTSLYSTSSLTTAWPGSQLVEWAIQMAQAMHFLANHGWAHRELCLENVLLDGRSVRLSGFGNACVYSKPQDDCGCLQAPITAPELFTTTVANQHTEWYELMRCCWSLRASDRPSFSNILQTLNAQMVESARSSYASIS